ncbi:MAG TPA: hypothetical protein VIL05_04560 [Thermoclostridium sp.]
MPIRPVDLQVMIPKVVDVSRIQANEQHQNLAALQSKNQSVEKQAEESMKQVNRQNELNKVSIRENNERRGRESKQEDKQNQNKKKEIKGKSNVYSKSNPGSTIDIRL